MKSMLIVAVLVITGLYATVVGVLAWQQRRFLYLPKTTRPDISTTGIANAHAVTVHTQDGLDLLAWLAPPADDTQPVVLYLHGNGGHIGDRASRFAALNHLGWGVLMLEYRGFGGNPGTPTEPGLYQDAWAAYAALQTLGISSRRIVVWGESLGSGVAVQLVTKAVVGAVILESPYTSITAIAQRRFPFIPVALLLRDHFDLISRIAAVHVPLLVMTGGRDTVVPPAMGKAVFAAANEPKAFWLAPDAGHNNLAASGALDVTKSFIAQYRTAAS